jgi:signal peptidase II
MAVVVITLLACVGCDQASKTIAKDELPRDKVLSFAQDTLRLQYAENKGAFLSIGSSLPETTRTMIFTVAIGAVLFALLGYLLLRPTLSLATTISLSLIAGGGLSNLIDRIVYDGHVIDFLNIGIGSLRSGIFNVADMAIMSGGILLIFKSLKQDQRAGS